MSSSPSPVRTRVVNMPISTIVPSWSPMRTYSPGRYVRVYIRMRPLAAWPTIPDAPIDTIRPISTDRPLNASVSDPGMYG